MKQIKTIIKPYEQLYGYDDEVNRYLSEGWKLRKREIQRVSGEINEAFYTPSIYVLYAELEKDIPDFEEVTL
jgi:hypothetical protein